MSIDDFAETVRERIESTFGDTSDLSEELVNTLCNVYYFSLKAQKLNFGGVDDLQQFHPGDDKAALIKRYMVHITHVTVSVRHAPNLINSMRSTRSEKPSVFAYIEQLTIGLLKYNIDNAERKSPIRRGLERMFKRPNEYPGLAKRFRVPFSRPS